MINPNREKAGSIRKFNINELLIEFHTEPDTMGLEIPKFEM